MTDNERLVFSLGGSAAAIGAVLGLVGNLIHPVTPMQDPEGVAQAIADSGAWVGIHMTIVIGIILMLGGLVAIYHSIRGGVPEVLARFGLFFGVGGITVGLVLVTLDGVAAPQLAEEWAETSANRGTALALVHLQETLNFALASLFNILFAGVTFILFGVAVALSDVYPRWLGWIVAAASVLSIAAGLIQAFTGEPSDASRVLTIIGPTIITLWLLTMGILLMRMAKSADSASNPGTVRR
jgi:hypothetical protein